MLYVESASLATFKTSPNPQRSVHLATRLAADFDDGYRRRSLLLLALEIQAITVGVSQVEVADTYSPCRKPAGGRGAIGRRQRKNGRQPPTMNESKSMLETLTDSSNADTLRTFAGIARDVVSLARKAQDSGADSDYSNSLQQLTRRMNEALIDVQAEALAALREQAIQAAKIRQLEQKITEYERWESEKARYELADVGLSHLYLLRETSTPDMEPRHYICPRCYEDKMKSILQYGHRHGSYTPLVCPRCEAVFRFDRRIASSHGVFG